MTIAVDLGRKATNPTNQPKNSYPFKMPVVNLFDDLRTKSESQLATQLPVADSNAHSK